MGWIDASTVVTTSFIRTSFLSSYKVISASVSTTVRRYGELVGSIIFYFWTVSLASFPYLAPMTLYDMVLMYQFRVDLFRKDILFRRLSTDSDQIQSILLAPSI